ncbi:MAG: hypothetical protein ABI448_16335 [Bacteroidia bacterium]
MELALGSREEFQYMKAALNSLTTLRGDLAHTHLKGTILSVQTVKETIKLFNDAVGGLKIMETYLRKIKFK